VHLPDGARTIDATGRFLIPGLWDAHVHTRYEGIDHLRLLVAHGITSARNMSGPWEHLAQVREWKDQISKGARVGPRIVTAGPILDGPGPGRSTSRVVINHPDEGRLAVRRIKREGADFVKVYNLLSRETFDAIANEAKGQQLPIAGHVPIALSPIDVSDAGLRFIEHLDAIAWASSDREEEVRARLQDWRSEPRTSPIIGAALAESFSTAKLALVAERLKANHTSVVPTLSLSWNRFERRGQRALVRSAERVQYVPRAYANAWGQEQSPYTAEDDRQQLELSLRIVRELHQAGINILAGTDVGTSFQIPGPSLHDELGLLVEAGLSPGAALLTATRNPARAMGLTDQGTIDPGMRADLVLLDANPLDDIDNVRKIRAVVAGGRVFERAELDAMLADIRLAANKWIGSPTR